MRLCRLILYCAVAGLMTAFLAACGSGNSGDTISSTTVPVVFFVQSAAVKSDGTVRTWGNNAYGQLGDTTSTNRSLPVTVAGLTGMSGASAGGSHTLAVSSGGGVSSWGNNGYGQLGNNSTNSTATPVTVLRFTGSGSTTSPLTGVTAVAGGGNHCLARDSSETVWAWGYNAYGQLGDTTTTARFAAVQVRSGVNGSSPLTGVNAIAAGGSHSMALISNGQVMSWGYNGYGQLGQKVRFQNLSTANRPYPDQVLKEDLTPLANISKIAAGGSHSLAVERSGDVWVWGYNALGQLGTGDVANRTDGAVQIQIRDANGALPGIVVDLAAGLDHSLFLMSDGSVYGCGLNYSGQLGNGSLGSIAAVTTLVRVMKGVNDPLVLAPGARIVAVGNQSLAMDSSGVYAWGDNTYGQLGVGSTVSSSYALKVTGF